MKLKLDRSSGLADSRARLLGCYRVRFRGLPRQISTEIFFERLTGAFRRHQRNLYDRPDFILCSLQRFGRNIDLLVQTTSKEALLERVARMKISCRSLRCRPFNPAGCPQVPPFSGWLVHHYGLTGDDPGRRRIRVRQRRPIGNNHTLHVFSRTVQQRLLFSEAEKEMMLQILERVTSELPVQMHTYCIMDNHFHLVLTTKKDVSVSRVMQKIKWSISRRYNQMHGTRGALWQGRFRHVVWEANCENLLRLIDYVHANPLRANLVADASQYRWSGYAHYAGSHRRRMLVVPLCLRRRYPHRSRREAWYRQHFLQRYRAGELTHDPDMSRRLAKGSKKFVEALVAELSDPKRLPAFLKDALKLRREGAVWGLKTLLYLLCRPAVQAWMAAQQTWSAVDVVGPLLPVGAT